MITDYLDIVNPRSRFTSKGRFYKTRPVNFDSDGGIEFYYEYVDPYSSTYTRLFGNVQGEEGTVTIRAVDQCGFAVKGYIVTGDGKLFQITQVEKDFQSAPKQARRFFGTPISTEYVLRLVIVDNPWGIK